MSIGLRIREIRNIKNLNQADFSQKIGIKQSPLSQMEGGKILPSIETLSRIIREFNISYSWLIDGEGEMFLEKTKSEENIKEKNFNENFNENFNKPNVKKTLKNENTEERVDYIDNVPIYYKEGLGNEEVYKGIPLIPIDAMAGFGSGEFQIMNYETSMYRIPEFEELNADFMIKVKGSSMYPKYSSGDTVGCKKLDLRDIFFQWNKVYVLDTVQGALIKRVKKGSDNEHILLVSENPNYEPFELHLSQIHAIAIVIGVILME